jgi:hypothetical protein
VSSIRRNGRWDGTRVRTEREREEERKKEGIEKIERQK